MNLGVRAGWVSRAAMPRAVFDQCSARCPDDGRMALSRVCRELGDFVLCLGERVSWVDRLLALLIAVAVEVENHRALITGFRGAGPFGIGNCACKLDSCWDVEGV